VKYRAYIGTYSVRASLGIYLIEADIAAGSIKILNSWQANSPAFLAVHEKILYSVLESGGYGGIASWAISDDGSLSQLSVRQTGGTSSCHVCASPDGKKIFVSNYGDGTLSVFDSNNGVLGEPKLYAHSGHGPNPVRQKGPHVHCSQIDPRSGRLCVVDLGIDRAVFYNIEDLTIEEIAAEKISAGSLITEPGSGPRHIVFSRTSSYAWLVCELSSEVYAFNVNNGQRIGVYSTLPADCSVESYCAAIKLSPDEKYLYASNRGHDSIACFKINPAAGALSLSAVIPSGGRSPRDFAFTVDGAFCLAANQDSDNIIVFKMENGLPAATNLRLEIPSPVCVLFV